MSDKKEMRCYVCDGADWIKLHGMSERAKEGWDKLQVCRKCGAVVHEVDVSKEPEILEYYRTQYRGRPNHMSFMTTSNKQNYILRFLDELLTDAKKKGKSLVCGDVGAATGYLPHALRERGHRATGSEMTTSYRRFSEAFYGVPLTEELEPKHKYDLISIYHVLEHMMEPDKKLSKYIEMLAPEGRLLISTPAWFDILEINAGSDILGFWNYFHKDHINAFSIPCLKNLFRKAGLIIEKEDHVLYGQTYLLRKPKKGEAAEPLEYENAEERVEQIKLFRKVIDLFNKGKHREAVDLYPKFPEAWIKLIFERYGKEPETQASTFEEAKKHLALNKRMRFAYGAWLFAYEKFAEALDIYGALMEVAPHSETVKKIALCQSHLGNPKSAMIHFYKSAEIDPRNWVECMELVCREACRVPHWEEVGKSKVKELLFKQAAPELKPKDPVMEPPKEEPAKK